MTILKMLPILKKSNIFLNILSVRFKCCQCWKYSQCSKDQINLKIRNKILKMLQALKKSKLSAAGASFSEIQRLMHHWRNLRCTIEEGNRRFRIISMQQSEIWNVSLEKKILSPIPNWFLSLIKDTHIKDSGEFCLNYCTL